MSVFFLTLVVSRICGVGSAKSIGRGESEEEPNDRHEQGQTEHEQEDERKFGWLSDAIGVFQAVG